MNQVEGFYRIPSFYDTRDIDLARALADHLDIHIPLRKRREHAARDSNHIAHLLSY